MSLYTLRLGLTEGDGHVTILAAKTGPLHSFSFKPNRRTSKVKLTKLNYFRISEISPPHNRGGLVDVHSAFLLIGYATAAWIGYAFFHYHPAANNQWRAPIGLQCLFPFLNLCIIRFLPESPRWLLSKGKEEQARVVLEKLHGREEMEVEFREIKAQILSDSAFEGTWKAVATKPSYRKRALLTMGVAFGIQMTGVLVVNSKYSKAPVPYIADSRHRLWA